MLFRSQTYVLLALFLVYFVIILRDKSFPRKYFGLNGFKYWSPLVIRFLIIAGLLTVLVWYFKPDRFFIIPRQEPLMWLLIMIGYPIWSVFPQELIYRGYFFHRFKILTNNEWLLILMNAFLFSFSHIVFGNWVAPVLTFFASIIFAFTYIKSRSLLVVFIEHLLYGNFIFTVGLGHYFYIPMG